jgi:bla regulator protein BlaR1
MESLNMQLQPFFEWLLRTTLQASLLICLILLLQAVLRGKLGVRWHYCLWLLLLVRMAMPWAPQSRASLFNLIPQRVPQQQTEYARQDTGEQSVGSDVASVSTGESTQTSTTAVEQDSPEATTATLRPHKEAKGPPRPAFFELAATLPLVWLTGALALAVYVCASNFNLLRIVKRRRPLTDQKILDLLEDCKSQMGIRTILGVVTTDLTVVLSHANPCEVIICWKFPAILGKIYSCSIQRPQHLFQKDEEFLLRNSLSVVY